MQRDALEHGLACHCSLSEITTGATIGALLNHASPRHMNHPKIQTSIHFYLPQSKHEFKQGSGRAVASAEDGFRSRVVGEQERFGVLDSA
jgi:hypothetical protein